MPARQVSLRFGRPMPQAGRCRGRQAGCEPLEKREQIPPPQPAPQHRATFGVDAVDLKDGLGEIEADGGDAHGGLPKLTRDRPS
jgi:hypothetical protein